MVNYLPKVVSGYTDEELHREIGAMIVAMAEDDYKPYSVQELRGRTYEIKFCPVWMGRPDLKHQERNMSDYRDLTESVEDSGEVSVDVTEDYFKRPAEEK